MNLPRDILTHIFSYLPDAPTFVNALCVNSRWYITGENIKDRKAIDYCRLQNDLELGESFYLLPNGARHGPYGRYVSKATAQTLSSSNPNQKFAVQYREEGRYVFGKKEGEWKGYYTSGELHNKATYCNDTIHGIRETYYLNGALATTEEFHFGLWHGKRIKYRNSAKTSQLTPMKIEETEYKYGLQHGERRKWDELGNMTYYGQFVEGGIHGIKQHYNNNKLILSAQYEKGWENGISKQWSLEGEMISQSHFFRGRLHGEQRYLDKNHHWIINHYVDGYQVGSKEKK